MPKNTSGVTYKTRYISPKYYQKLAIRQKKVISVSGYLKKPGKDKKLYETRV